MHYQKDVVYIDDREPKAVKDTLNKHFNTQQIKTRITRMDTGDFFYNGILLERKDCVDFIASWKDARMINQRNKMIREAHKNNYHPYILVQGSYTEATQTLKTINKIQLKYTWKAWLNGILSLNEKGIQVITLSQRRNHNNIAYVLEGLAKYKNEDKVLHDIFIEPEGQSWDMKAYQCLNGIGYTTAKTLADNMSIRDLLRRPKENAIETLCSYKNIGRKKAEYIYETIHKNEKLTPYKELKN